MCRPVIDAALNDPAATVPYDRISVRLRVLAGHSGGTGNDAAAVRNTIAS